MSTREDEFPPDGNLRHEWEDAVAEVCYCMDKYSGRINNIRRKRVGYAIAFKEAWINQNRKRKNAENRVTAALGALISERLNVSTYDFGVNNERLQALNRSFDAFNQTEMGKIIPRGGMQEYQLHDRVVFLQKPQKMFYFFLLKLNINILWNSRELSRTIQSYDTEFRFV